MKSWSLRLGGLILMIVGVYLFVWAVRDISAEWPQIFTGLLSVFSISMGFGILIMPGNPSPSPSSNPDQLKE